MRLTNTRAATIAAATALTATLGGCGGRPAHPPAPAPASEEAPPAFRLPTTVRPVRYALELSIDAAQPTFRGEVEIALALDAPTSVVWLHAQDLTFDRVELGGMAATVERGEGSLVGLRVARAVPAGEATLEIGYQGTIDRERSRGIYAVAEGDAWYAYTFFEPIDARRAVPCFDEPGFKVPWQVTFRTPPGQVAVGNEPTVSEVVGDDGWTTTVTAETPPMPSYLLAFVVGPFDLVDGGVAGAARVPVRFVAPAGRAAELRWAKAITPDVVATLEDTLGMPYPYAKLDVAVVPRFWGTMEHPGIVAMGQPLTLIRPEDETAGRKRWYMNILAHELAHYWFGDLVTMAWWNDTWLNEALGTWLDRRVSERVEPAGHWAEEAVDRRSMALAADELAATRALRTAVTDEEGIQASFDNSITYFKGASVLHMIERWVGEARFAGFQRRYLEAHAWRNASAEDFTAVMRQELGDDAAAVFESYLDAPGAPLISATLRCDGGAARVELTQRRSRIEDDTRWQVPVCVRHGRGAEASRTCGVLRDATGTVELGASCPTWWVANAGGDGYYRVEIDAAELAALAATPALSTTERLVLLDDARAAVERGALSPVDVQSLVPALAGEPNPTLVSGALGLLGLLQPAWLDDAHFARYEAHVADLLGARARALGWHRRDGDSDDVHDVRRALIATVVDADDALAREGAALGARWLDGERSLADDQVGTALWLVVRRGGAAAFDQVLARARAEADHRTRRRLLGSLSAAVEPELVARALALTTDATLDPRDRLTPLYGLLFLRETRDAAWAYVRDHLDALRAAMRDDEAGGMIGMLAWATCDRARLAEVVAAVEGIAAEVDGAANHLRKGVEQAEQCIEQRERHGAAVDAYLEAVADGPTAR